MEYGQAAVLERYNEPLQMRSLPLVPLEPGQVRIRMICAGVCGSDVHIWRGNDPRTPLPMIPGHEGVGRIAEMNGGKKDIFGRELHPGDTVLWERGVMCGNCFYCTIKKQPALCPARRTYGISYGCDEPPHFLGCYAQHLHLRAGHPMIKLDFDTPPEVLVPATCSGATAAHAVETSGIRPGDFAVVIGPGPLGLFALAQLRHAGAAEVWAAGTDADRRRLELAREFGAAGTLNVDVLKPEEITECINDASRGIGPNVIMDCTGHAGVIPQWIDLTAPGGTYSIPGIATPQDDIPVDVFTTIARKNLRFQGVWVSDTSHLWSAVNLAARSGLPFHKLITHTYPLGEATKALEVTESKQSIKAVLTMTE